MITVSWSPIVHVGPLPLNWYGLGWVVAFIAASTMIRRWATHSSIDTSVVERLLIWTLLGAILGARLYYVAQSDPIGYLRQPWRMLAVWEGGLAFFGGLFGATFAAYIFARHQSFSFSTAADLFAPAIPIAGAIGRIACGLTGMDYGKPTTLPWGVIYSNPASYAPNDGVPRHPVQFYELAGDLLIAAALLKLRGRLPRGVLFLTYLVLFSALRFSLFFLRGDVPIVAFGLTNGHLTAIVIAAAAIPLWIRTYFRSARPVAS